MLLKDQILSSRVNGILIPLAAMKTAHDWGVGDFSSLTEWIDLVSVQGTKILQILPLQETAPGINCPYSALTAFATDPVYADVTAVPEVQKSREAQDYLVSLSDKISEWHGAKKAPFFPVKQAKLKTLWLGYQYFLTAEKSVHSARYQAFEAYESAQAGWLKSYKVFRALKEFYNWQSWLEWPENLRNHEPTAVHAFEVQYQEYVDFFAYVQWILDQQLRLAKAHAQEKNVWLFGDIPFATNLDSAEVWAERENFRLGYETGAPADQFSKGGQRWGLPAYDWEYQHTHGLDLWRRKIRRATELYDIFRLDHLVGFFRTYIFAPQQEQGFFDVQGEENQLARGRAFLTMVQEQAGACLAVGEDLGVIPNYVRQLLVEMRIPGYKVLRWEREDNGYYREPRNYPVISLATTSTHDTETLRGWWETENRTERAHIWEMISAQKTLEGAPWCPDTQRAILKRVLDSASALTMFSWQDIIGSTDRVNTPGTVGENNWTYRSDCTPLEAVQKYADMLKMYQQLLKETGRS